MDMALQPGKQTKLASHDMMSREGRIVEREIPRNHGMFANSKGGFDATLSHSERSLLGRSSSVVRRSDLAKTAEIGYRHLDTLREAAMQHQRLLEGDCRGVLTPKSDPGIRNMLRKKLERPTNPAVFLDRRGIVNGSKEQPQHLERENLAQKRGFISPIARTSRGEELIYGPRGESLTSYENDIIGAVWNGNHDEDENEVICTKFNLEVRRKHLKCLQDGEWLNDEVINFFMQSLMEKTKAPRIFIWYTYFYTKLMETGRFEFENVRKWTIRNKLDMFAYEKILVPINTASHWALAIINLRDRRFEYYDSLGFENDSCLENLQKWLEHEFFQSRRKALDLSGWRKVFPPGLPRQRNSCDCGVFLCQFASTVGVDRKVEFTQEHMAFFRRKILLEILRESRFPVLK